MNNLFVREKADEKLRTLSKTRLGRKTELTKGCAINLTLSWYIGCHGEREELRTNASFELSWVENNGGKYKLKVRLH